METLWLIKWRTRNGRHGGRGRVKYPTATVATEYAKRLNARFPHMVHWCAPHDPEDAPRIPSRLLTEAIMHSLN